MRSRMGKRQKANRSYRNWGRQHMRIDKGVSFLVLFGFGLAVLPGIAQTAADKYPENPTPQVNVPSKTARLGRLPIEWIIGPYIPVQGQLETLSNAQRGQIYVRQTFLTAGSYMARGFSAGLDQARGEPSDWGGGSVGYGRRYAARYGEFVVQSSILSGGNALLGYEPRYDFCRCEGFWPRTRHAREAIYHQSWSVVREIEHHCGQPNRNCQ